MANASEQSSYDETERIVYQLLVPVVCIPGVLTAALSALIFHRMRRSSLDVLLFGLSLFDVLLLSCSLIMFPAMSMCTAAPDFEQNTTFACHFFWQTTVRSYPLSVIAQTGSVWMCVAVTVDRFIAVSHPMKLLVICTKANAAIAFAAITIFSVVYKLPSFFEVRLDEEGKMQSTDLRMNDMYVLVYHVYGYFLMLLVIPWSTIIILNTIIIRKIRKAYRARNLLTNSVRRERKEEAERRMTIMTIVVATLFITCNVPSGINHLIEAFIPSLNSVWRQRIPISNLLVCINSASNMIIYSVFNRKFRQYVLELLMPWVNKRRWRCSSYINEMERSRREQSSTMLKKEQPHTRLDERRSVESFSSFALHQSPQIIASQSCFFDAT